MQTAEKIKDLKVFAEEIRVTTLKGFREVGSGHVGGAMSIVETLAVLYGGVMKIDPNNPQWDERSHLVLSKGHAGPALYATLALKGYFPMDELYTINRPGTNLPSHCDRNKTVGVDMTTGSLGQGYSTALGLAMASRLLGHDSYTYLIVGDGELNEGQNWEGAMFAAHYKVDNMIVFVDENKQQLDGLTKDVMNMFDIGEKFKSFGYFVQKVDGHDVGAILDAVEAAEKVSGMPKVIILDTIKGKGCILTEPIVPSHHIAFKREQMDEAIAVAEKALADARAL